MHKPYFWLTTIILASFLTGCTGSAAAQSNEIPPTSAPAIAEPTTAFEVVSKDPPKDCPLTIPQDPPFTPPTPYDALGFKGEFWFGSNSLWTAVRENGIWADLPHNPEGYTQKVFWWREGYSVSAEPEPNLTVTGERLDAKTPPLVASKATNASAGDIGSAMLVGVDLPTLGCWKITGKYKGAELSFVVWVAP